MFFLKVVLLVAWMLEPNKNKHLVIPVRVIHYGFLVIHV